MIKYHNEAILDSRGEKVIQNKGFYAKLLSEKKNIKITYEISGLLELLNIL